MASSSASTVEEYLAQLPEERRRVISAVRDVVVENLPEGYEETVSWGMLSYEIPLERYPKTYNKKPLGYVGLAAQKNYYSLYLLGIYSTEREEWLREEFRKAGKKLDMGKSCLRFKKVEELPLELIGRVIAEIPPDRFIEIHEAARAR